MMSGAIQTAITKTIDGHGGLAGWKWLFIINGIMTIVWGFAGFFMLPDLPNRPNPRAVWFGKAHAELSMERLARHGRTEPKRMSWGGCRRAFSGWILYFIAALYIATVLGTTATSYFSVFLKALKNPDGSRRWSVAQVNAIPIGGGAINVVFVWIWALLSDFLKTRWTLIVAQGVLGLVPGVIMSIWSSKPESVPMSAAYASYFILYMCMGTAPLIFSWLSDLVPRDPEARTLIVGVSVASYYAISAWAEYLIWPTAEFPFCKNGWDASLALMLLVIVIAAALRFIDVRYIRAPAPLLESHQVEVGVGGFDQGEGVSDEQAKGPDSVDSSKGPTIQSSAL